MDAEQILVMVGMAKEFRPVVEAAVVELEAYKPILKRFAENVALWTVDIRVKMIAEFEAAGFTCEEAIAMTMDDYLAWRQVAKKLVDSRK